MLFGLTVSQLGLIADMIGVLLLFRYGLPSQVEPEDAGVLTWREDDDKIYDAIKDKNRKIRRRANIGLGLVLLGFALQFIGGFR